MNARKIEFYVTPDGRVKIEEEGVPYTKEYTVKDKEFTNYIAELIKRQYPEAYHALEEQYKGSSAYSPYYLFLIVHRFIRCNFGKYDGLSYDIEGSVLHIEDISCPLKWRNDCPLCGVVCKPRPFGLSPRETEVVRMKNSGKSYDEIADELGIAHSTIKNVIQKAKEKLQLNSSRDIAKLFITAL